MTDDVYLCVFCPDMLLLNWQLKMKPLPCMLAFSFSNLMVLLCIHKFDKMHNITD